MTFDNHGSLTWFPEYPSKDASSTNALQKKSLCGHEITSSMQAKKSKACNEPIIRRSKARPATSQAGQNSAVQQTERSNERRRRHAISRKRLSLQHSRLGSLQQAAGRVHLGRRRVSPGRNVCTCTAEVALDWDCPPTLISMHA